MRFEHRWYRAQWVRVLGSGCLEKKVTLGVGVDIAGGEGQVTGFLGLVLRKGEGGEEGRGILSEEPSWL